VIFLIVGLAHGCRAAMGWPVLIGSHSVPVWASWVMAAGGLVLGVWGLKSKS
jgi:hypothetical protein